jgi:hypothetical protein
MESIELWNSTENELKHSTENELKQVNLGKKVWNTLLKYLDKFMNIFDTFPVNID